MRIDTPPRRARGAAALLALATALAPAWCLRAQDSALDDHPGYVDFALTGLFSDDDLEIHVSVKDPLLDLVAEATRDSEPDLAAMMAKLRAIEVWVYDVGDAHRDGVRRHVGKIAERLEADGWETLITIRQRDSRGYVFLRHHGGTTAGLAALSVDNGEAVFVNIVGEIDPSRIGRLARKFKIQMLEDAVEERTRQDDSD